MMSLSMTLAEKYELIAIAYIRLQQKALPYKHNPWYNIPDLVTQIILQYLGLQYTLHTHIPLYIFILLTFGVLYT